MNLVQKSDNTVIAEATQALLSGMDYTGMHQIRDVAIGRRGCRLHGTEYTVTVMVEGFEQPLRIVVMSIDRAVGVQKNILALMESQPLLDKTPECEEERKGANFQ